MNQIVQVPGNAEVVKAIEKWLAFARQGRVNCAAVVLVTPPDAICDFGGNAAMFQGPLQEGLAGLNAAVEASVKSRAVPPVQEPGADYVTYNFTNGPASYDVIPWLVEQEMTRIREAAPAPLKVHWWMASDNGGLDASPLRRQIFENVMRPALALIGAVETDRVGRAPGKFTSLGVVQAARGGEDVPRLRCPFAPAKPAVPHGQPPVTITLREMKEWRHRNSNVGAWLKFARYLKDKGERVVFVRDTAKADERLPGFETAPLASRNLHSRFDLYQRAKANLFTTNGPTTLATFSGVPYLQFITVVPEDHPCDPDKASFWLANHGMRVGEQWPWASEKQRLVWGKDDYDRIFQAWDQLERSGR